TVPTSAWTGLFACSRSKLGRRCRSMYALLQGLRVLDLTRLLPGAYATQLLGDLGAEVLKIEDPWQGEYMRRMPPHLTGTRASRLFWGLNRNKKSMTL